MHLLRSSWLACFMLIACDGDPPDEDGGMGDAGGDAGPDAGDVDAGPPGACNGPPGLYEGTICDDAHLAAGVRPFHPRFALWADEADKDRYIQIPTGTQIDTTDPDNWVFPVGTTVWKTFSLDGVRLETRILTKVEPGAGDARWRVEAWAWNEAQDSVTEVSTLGLAFRENVLGTEHDIPDADECVRCHTGAFGTHDMLNGFGAIQLNHNEDGITLQTLIDEGLLSTAMPNATQTWIEASTFPARNDVEREALGYLHANCGHCHRQGGEGTATALQSFITTGAADFDDLPIFGAVGAISYATGARECEIHPNSEPDRSVVMIRMLNRGDTLQMPPLATEMLDTTGAAAVRAWLEALNEPLPTGVSEWPCLAPP